MTLTITVKHWDQKDVLWGTHSVYARQSFYLQASQGGMFSTEVDLCHQNVQGSNAAPSTPDVGKKEQKGGHIHKWDLSMNLKNTCGDWELLKPHCVRNF